MSREFKLEEVLSELADSRPSGLEKLFNYYYPRLYNFSKAFLKLEDGIDDILQEVFLKIWDNRKNITNSITFESFIFTITRNLLLNELRSRLNNQKMKEQLLMASVPEEYLNLGLSAYDELKSEIESVIDELPPRQKDIFRLSRIEGLSHKEIAQKLGIGTKTVEYHISKSISHIKARLKSLGWLYILCFFFW